MGRGIEEGSWHVVRFAITASIMFVVSFFIRDYLSIGLTADSLPLLVTSLFLGAVIGYQVSCVLGITSFFMTESWGLRQFWWMLQTFAVGFLIPISFYPEWAQTLISYSPFPLMMFVPIELIQGIETFSHAQAIFLGLGWIVIIQCIIMTTWRIGIRRYEGTGA
jgi:ABC-2 type transport system permease protein